MPLIVEWKIGKKPRGNFLTPLEFKIKIEDGEDLKLAPEFVFEKRYSLPEPIILISNKNGTPINKRSIGSIACREIKTIGYKIGSNNDDFIFFSRPYTVNQRPSLTWGYGYRVCTHECDSCRAYLPWRPGVPDYSDFEQVFHQVAHDLCTAWNEAVQKAMDSIEFELNRVTIESVRVSDNWLALKEVEQGRPSRKLKIA